MIRLRHQIPVHSPISAGALLRATSAIGNGAGSRLRLESVLRERYEADRVILTGSGTQALQLALMVAFAADPERARTVALPAFCCYDVATAAVGADARIALYDVDPETLAPDPESLERVLDGGRVGVMVAAPLYGVPLPWDHLEATAAAHGASLIEDAAQGHGAAWRGRRLGALGRISVLSFGRGKGWTGGGGGALLLRGVHAAADLPPLSTPTGLRSLLATGVQWALGRPALYGIPASIPVLALGETVYHPPEPVEAMASASIALALRTRQSSEMEAEHRRRSGEQYAQALTDQGQIALARPATGSLPGWLRFPIRINGGLNALDDPREGLRRGLGRTYQTTLAKLPAVRDRLVGAGDRWRGAETLVRELLTLPTHSQVSERDREVALRLVRAVGR